MMRLQYFPVNAAWAFTFGDAPMRIGDYELFYAKRKDAVDAAKHHGLKVTKSGAVESDGPNPFKSRKSNPGPRPGPRPAPKMGFAIYARKGSGPRMHYDGRKYSNNGKPMIFASANVAKDNARKHLASYPVLRGYALTVEPYAGK